MKNQPCTMVELLDTINLPANDKKELKKVAHQCDSFCESIATGLSEARKLWLQVTSRKYAKLLGRHSH